VVTPPTPRGEASSHVVHQRQQSQPDLPRAGRRAITSGSQFARTATRRAPTGKQVGISEGIRGQEACRDESGSELGPLRAAPSRGGSRDLRPALRRPRAIAQEQTSDDAAPYAIFLRVSRRHGGAPRRTRSTDHRRLTTRAWVAGACCLTRIVARHLVSSARGPRSASRLHGVLRWLALRDVAHPGALFTQSYLRETRIHVIVLLATPDVL
jgi:hypothetical protein